MGRVDQSLGKNDKLTTGRFEYDRFTHSFRFQSAVSCGIQRRDYGDHRAKKLMIQETHTFSPVVLNDFRFSFSRQVSHSGTKYGSAVNATAFGRARCHSSRRQTQFKALACRADSASEIIPTGVFYRRNIFIFADDLVWEKGKNDIHIGGSIERSHVNLNNQFNQPGIFGFGTSDNYLFGGASFQTYQLLLAGILSDGSSTGNGFAFQQGAGEFKQNFDTFLGFVSPGQHPGHAPAHGESRAEMGTRPALARSGRPLGASESRRNGCERSFQGLPQRTSGNLLLRCQRCSQ